MYASNHKIHSAPISVRYLAIVLLFVGCFFVSVDAYSEDKGTENQSQHLMSNSDNTSKNIATAADGSKDTETVTTTTINPLNALMANDEHSAKEEDSVANVQQTQEEIRDSFGRDTPRGTVQGFLKAISAHDYPLASQYLSIKKTENATDLIRKFKKALDHGGRFNSEMQISNNPQGDFSDNLPSHIDQVGSINIHADNGDKDLEIPIRLVHRVTKEGGYVWLFSIDTLNAAVKTTANASPSFVEQYGIDFLSKKTFFNANIQEIIVIFLLIILSFSGIYVCFWLLYLFLSISYPRLGNQALPFTDNVVLPLSVVITALFIPDLLLMSGISVTARESVSRFVDIFAWMSITWLLFRIIDTVFFRAEELSRKHGKVEQIALIELIRKLSKVVLFIFTVIIVFGNLGFDLTTGIATLGIGGLALALGAQKTVENLVGSLVVVADQPVRVGDYCHFGSKEGTVIDIGIRSTRLLTRQRTIVTIPNGDFASLPIENFTARDMFQFLHCMYLKRQTDTDVLNKLIRELDEYLNGHYLTNKEWNQVRIKELRQDCFVIEFQAYIDAKNLLEFYDKQNLVLIDLLKKVGSYDVEHALPTTHIHVE